MKTKTELYAERVYNILVIEDLPSWQKKFCRFLRDEPFEVVIATNYPEAVILAEIYTFDLLIVDVNLSGVPYNVDGLIVADEIWRKNKNVKIIIVSGSQEWNKRLGIYSFDPSFIFEKQNLDHDDFIRKIYQVLGD